MKLQYLGTAAAEGWPALFCDCDNCARARAAGGRNLRTRSQAMVDGRLLIDFPPDTYFHLLTNSIDISYLENLIITHTHEDHWYPDDLFCRYAWGANYRHPETLKPLTVWGSDIVEAKVAELEARRPQDKRLCYGKLTPYESTAIDGYTVTPLPANHAPETRAVIYQISDGERTMLYGNDTGIPCEAVWEYWASHPVHFDLLSLDCTGIVKNWRDGHMGLASNKEVVERLKAMGLADDATRVVVHHFSHNGGLIYDELVKEVAPWGWDVSYDGMVVEF